MALSCGMSGIKYLIFLINFVTMFIGVIMVVVGGVTMANFSNFENILQNESTHVPLALIVIGVIIMMISFFGCCGSIRESRCMISTYAFFLLIIVLIQIVIGAVAFVNRGEIVKDSQVVFTKIFQHRNETGAKESIDAVQKLLHCCGDNGPSDYLIALPDSCCPKSSTCTILNSYQLGCKKALADGINGNAAIVGWVSFIFAAVMFLGLVFSCCLSNSIRSEYSSFD